MLPFRTQFDVFGSDVEILRSALPSLRSGFVMFQRAKDAFNRAIEVFRLAELAFGT